MVQRRPVLVALGATAAMAVIALPVVDMRLSQGDARLLPAGTQTRQLHDLMVTHFPELVRPDGVDVVVAAPTTDRGVAALRDRIAALPDVTVTGGHRVR
jgi:RND superfamily putative drug exporter